MGLKKEKMNRSLFSVLKSSDGFTLLEILISVVFITIGFLGLASTVTTVMHGNKLSGEQTEAVIMAQEKLEELKNKDFNMGADFAIGGGDDTIDADLADDGDTADVGTDARNNPSLFTSPDHSDAGFSGGITTTPQRVWNVADDTPAPGMKTITVIVAWTGVNDHFVALTTAIKGSVS